MRILGIDPGLNTTGYGVVEVVDRQIRLVEAGVVRGKTKGSLTARIQEIHDGVADVIRSLEPGALALEKLYSHYDRPTTAILMGHARGVIVLAAAQASIDVFDYAATQVKKTLTGNGRAPKTQMQEAIRRELRLSKTPEPPDVADALAIALCHAWSAPGSAGGVAPGRRRNYHHATPGQSPGLKGDMITKITGIPIVVAGDVLTLAVGAFEYEVLVPEFARRQLQAQIGRETSLHTIEYLEGNQMASRLTPRLVGFLNPIEREFFELFCQVDGVGVKKALRAMVRPVQDVAGLIEEQDAKGLAALPGIGPATAERIIAKLRRKVPKFALLVGHGLPEGVATERDVLSETFDALRALGHGEGDARRLLDDALGRKKKYKDVDELLRAVYEQRHEA